MNGDRDVVDITGDKEIVGVQQSAAYNGPPMIDLTSTRNNGDDQSIAIPDSSTDHVNPSDAYDPADIIDLTGANNCPHPELVPSDDEDKLPDLVCNDSDGNPGGNFANVHVPFSPASPSVESDTSVPEIAQNQLMDCEAAVKYDRDWYGRHFFNY